MAFEHIELPAKLLDYFLRSNKSNINQLSNVLADGVLVKAERACQTPRESLADNLFFCANDRIVIARLFFSQDPQETKNSGYI